MYAHFDYHSPTRRFAILTDHPIHGRTISLLSGDGKELGRVPTSYLPLTPRWSPDGEMIAFGGNDGVLYLYHPGQPSPLPIFNDPGFLASFCEWAPDGQRLVFSAHDRTGNPPDIYTLNIHTREVRAVTNNRGTVDRFPRWSPDGKWIAFHREEANARERLKQVWLYDIETGRTFPIRTRTGEDLIGYRSWHPTEPVVLLTNTREEKRSLECVHVDGKRVFLIEAENINGGVFSPQGDRVVCACRDRILWVEHPTGKILDQLSLEPYAPVRASFSGPVMRMEQAEEALYFLAEDGKIYQWRIGSGCQIWGEDEPYQQPNFQVEEYRVRSFDGTQVPVLRYVPSQPSGLSILYIHGGPGEEIGTNSFMLYWLGRGVEFVCPAYRGCGGYGNEYRDANRGECGRADVLDVLAVGRDWHERLGGGREQLIIGFSYGGFLTLLALQQPGAPWQAGAALWSLSSLERLQSIYLHCLPEDPVERDAALLERSPLLWPEKIKVPLVLFHGGMDFVATTEELVQFQQHVQDSGGRCELFVFEDDTHGLRRHRAEIYAILEREFGL
jgi:dipeptidyl aminopeptidase/acylaminoacyl peptidase